MRKSWLIVPASKPDEIQRAAHAGADAVVLDLVELVRDEDKAHARENVKLSLGTARAGGADVFIQTTPDSAHSDLPASIWPGVAGVVLSRAESLADVARVSELLSRLEMERSIAAGRLEIVAALETARGNQAAYDIATSSPRVSALTLGRADLIMDLRPEPSGDLHLMQYLMQRLVIVASAAGVTPLGAWWRAPDRGLLATPDNTRAAAKRGRAIGFKGAMCLTSDQVAPINEAFAGCKEVRREPRRPHSAAGELPPSRADEARPTVRRSGLTMPIVTPRFVDNAWRRGCDFVTLDLEDSVPENLKSHARTLVKDAIPVVAKGGTEVFVRINHDLMVEDLEGAIWPGIARVKYPKTEYAHEVRKLDETLTRLEGERGIPEGTVEIDASIETAMGVANVFDIAAASPRVREFGATTGGYDLSRDLGVEMFVDFDQFVYPKGEAELAARTLGLGLRATPFVANTTGSVSDGNRALTQAQAAHRCGFTLGGGGLNPAVVESHNRGYTPTEDDVRDARAVLEQWDEVQRSGEAWSAVEGRVIDRYEADRARRTIEWSERCAMRDREKTEAVARVRGST